MLVWAGAGTAGGQAVSLRLPLPVDEVAGAGAFETAGPVAGVLTGVLLPTSGPLTGWAPVFSTLGADGTLKEDRTGEWAGVRPGRWLKAVRPGFVVGGFRVLVRTVPTPVQVRQVQIFWKPWSGGEARGEVVTSRVYGQAAGPDDQVRIVELTLPEGTVPTGLYGQVLGGAVVQASLTVRRTAVQAAGREAPAAPVQGPQAVREVPVPVRPPVPGPAAPQVPQVDLAQ